jgi:hypothetical protein
VFIRGSFLFNSAGSPIAIETMNYISFPLRIESTGALARSSGADENLLRLLKIMFTTPSNGWPGSPMFGLRDALAAIAVKGQVRLDTVRRVNETLLELGIDWVEVKTIESVPADRVFEQAYLLTLLHKDRGTELQQIKL